MAEPTSPWRISWRNWRQVLWRACRGAMRNDVSTMAASVAFYAMFAFLPAMLGVVSLYGLIADPNTVAANAEAVAKPIPDAARQVLLEEMAALVAAPRAQLGTSLVVSLAVTVVSASTGAYALLRGVNLAYGETETRGYLALRLKALELTLFGMAIVVLAVFGITLLPPALEIIGLGELGKTAITLARWPVLGSLVAAVLAVVYRSAPNRKAPKWRWVIVGALAATLIWLLASWLFSLYAAHFAHFNRTYGVLTGPLVLLSWLYLSNVAILLGAELNSELERQLR